MCGGRGDRRPDEDDSDLPALEDIVCIELSSVAVDPADLRVSQGATATARPIQRPLVATRDRRGAASAPRCPRLAHRTRRSCPSRQGLVGPPRSHRTRTTPCSRPAPCEGAGCGSSTYQRRSRSRAHASSLISYQHNLSRPFRRLARYRRAPATSPRCVCCSGMWCWSSYSTRRSHSGIARQPPLAARERRSGVVVHRNAERHEDQRLDGPARRRITGGKVRVRVPSLPPDTSPR